MSHPLDLARSESDFEKIRQVASHGAEYWSARDLMQRLGYVNWQNFERVIERAQTACERTGQGVSYHFTGVSKVISAGKGAELERKDYFVSRYAAYLIAMNGDSRKPQIALAQRYFAVQTRRQELHDQLSCSEKRIELRNRLANSNKRLNEAAYNAGVRQKMFGVFYDKGYQGLYGLCLREIKQRKGIPSKNNPADYMGSTELAANDFRATQTEERLNRENIQSAPTAITIHFQVGQSVRETILKQGNTPPEDLPPEENIKPMLAKWHKERKQLESETAGIQSSKIAGELPPGDNLQCET